MSAAKTISIITIHYNHLDGLKRTAESILLQTRRDFFEWIVVDGGSDDGSVDFLKELGSGIDCLISEKDRGIYDAMNKGIAQSTGKYLWFMNAGDTIHNHDVVAQIEEALLDSEADGADVIFGDTMFVEPKGAEIGLISQLKPQPFPTRLHGGSFRFGMNICHQSFLAKRSLGVQFDLEYKQASDIDWIIRVLQFSKQSLRLNFVVSNFEVGGSSYQHTQKAWKERYLVLQRHYGVIPNFFAHVWIMFRRLLFNLNLLGKHSTGKGL